jgi:hypothetical protein
MIAKSVTLSPTSSVLYVAFRNCVAPTQAEVTRIRIIIPQITFFKEKEQSFV